MGRLPAVIVAVAAFLSLAACLSFAAPAAFAEQNDGFSGERGFGYFARYAAGGPPLIAETSRQNEVSPQFVADPHATPPTPVMKEDARKAAGDVADSESLEAEVDKLVKTEDRAAPRNTAALIKDALTAYREKRTADAVAGLEEAASDGSLVARFLLAHLYRTGKAGEVNHPKAYHYYQQITSEFSDNGPYYARLTPFVAHSYVQLARYMEIGIKELNISADPYVARMLFEKAAHFGDVEGQYQLGRFLIETGQMRNVKLGQRWLTRAAIKNNPKAQAYLGALYWQGDLISRKQSLALAWIEFARRNASGSVKHQVERLYEAVRFDLSEDQHNRAALFIGQLRSKYNVLWREVPVKKSPTRELLDGIVLAEPPQGLDVDELETKQPRNHMPEVYSGQEGFPQNNASSFGFQMFGLGAGGDR